MFALAVFLYAFGFVAGPALYLLACLRANGFSWIVSGGIAGCAGAIDPRPLAVPHAEHAGILALAMELRLLGPPERGRGEVLVDPWLKDDVVLVEKPFRRRHLLVEAAERRAAIAGDVARGVVAGLKVALALEHRQPHQRLDAGQENPAPVLGVLVVEGDFGKRHDAVSFRPVRT